MAIKFSLAIFLLALSFKLDALGAFLISQGASGFVISVGSVFLIGISTFFFFEGVLDIKNQNDALSANLESLKTLISDNIVQKRDERLDSMASFIEGNAEVQNQILDSLRNLEDNFEDITDKVTNFENNVKHQKENFEDFQENVETDLSKLCDSINAIETEFKRQNESNRELFQSFHERYLKFAKEDEKFLRELYKELKS